MKYFKSIGAIIIFIVNTQSAFAQCCGDGVCDPGETPLNCIDCATSTFNCNNTIGSFFNSPTWPVNSSTAQANGWCYSLTPPFPSQVCFEYQVPNVLDSASVSFIIDACGGTSVNQSNYPPIGGCNNSGYSSGTITGVSTYDNSCSLISNFITTGGAGCYNPGDIITICIDINTSTACSQITICPVIACGQTNCSTSATSVGCPPFNFSDSTFILPCDSNSGVAIVTPDCGNHFTYLWDDPLTQTDSIAVGLTPGNYNVTITNVAFNCDTTISLTVPNTDTIPTTLINSPDTICLNEKLILNAITSSGLITWYSDINASNIIGTGTPLVLNNPGAGIHTYYVNSTTTCTSNIDSINILVNNTTAIINASLTTGSIPLNVFFGNGSSTGSGITYSWDFDDGSFSNLFEPNNIYTNTGTYTTTLIVSDGICFDTAIVVIDAYGDSEIIIPNVFTPNDDGQNDFFTISGVNLMQIEGEIYNRWGQLLYTWRHLKEAWDGRTLAGEIYPDGTYFYIIKAKAVDGEEYLKKGTVSLLR